MTAKEENRSTLVDWAIFLVATVIGVYLVAVGNPWFWLTLPFIGTYLARAFKAI